MTDLKPKLAELQANFDQARTRLKEFCARGVNFNEQVWLSKYQKSDALILDLERQIAARKNEDTTFECLAEAFIVEVDDKSMPDFLSYACHRLTAR